MVSFDQLKFMGTVGLKLMECSRILHIGFPFLDIWEDMSRAGHKVGSGQEFKKEKKPTQELEKRSLNSLGNRFKNLKCLFKNIYENMYM